MGSFSVIHHNLNKELQKVGIYSPPETSDWVGHCSGLDLDFQSFGKRRFLIHVFETTVLNEWFLKFRKATKK